MSSEKLTHYQGAYTVELTDDAPTDNLPEGANVSDATVTVEAGSVQQVTGGIQFYAGDKPFTWGYKGIKRILDADGKTLWENWDLKNE